MTLMFIGTFNEPEQLEPPEPPENLEQPKQPVTSEEIIPFAACRKRQT